jgi:hypothetical protein
MIINVTFIVILCIRMIYTFGLSAYKWTVTNSTDKTLKILFQQTVYTRLFKQEINKK